MSGLSVKEHCLYHLEDLIDKAYEEGLDGIELSLTMANMIYNLINSQEIKEPLEDVIMFAGRADKHMMCYHILLRQEAARLMERDPNIHFMRTKLFTGVLDRDDEDPISPKYTDEKHAYCGECGKRLVLKHRVTFCPRCGRKVKWAS